MIVYSHRPFTLNIPSFLRDLLTRLERAPASLDRDAILELLIDFGEAYSAAADALLPEEDDDVTTLRGWADAAHALAQALVAAWHHDWDGARAAIASCREFVASLRATSTIGDVSAKPAEGFAFYGLYPEQYILAAEQAVSHRPGRTLTCIGVRSIGAPLAHVVGAAAERLGTRGEVITVRPRGHPFDRRLHVSDRLRRRLVERRDGWFGVVDEGPGLSGSSFAAVSDALMNLGIPEDAIVLFPSWCPPRDALRSDRGRRAVERHAKAIGRFEDVVHTDGMIDLSGGNWRARVIGADEHHWPAVHPQHERRKYLTADGTRIMRFAGLGRYGRKARQRAQTLAAAGFAAAPLDLRHGFLTLAWIDGEPAARERIATRAADYLTFLRRTFATTERARTDDIVEMMKVNIEEGVGGDAAAAIEPLAHDARRFDEPAVAIDARMQQHEWIASAGAVLKMDGLDHHADDFFPGCRDIAWDIAGAAVELNLDEAAARTLAARYADGTRDRTIPLRMPFYEAAYLAYRLGYVTLAAESLAGSADGERFTRLRTRCRRSLEVLAARRR